MVNESYCETFGWVSKENLARMQELTFKGENSSPSVTSPLNRPNSSLKSTRIKPASSNSLLSTSPDGARLWDKQTLDKMDKDRFRQSLGGVVEAYEDSDGMILVVCRGNHQLYAKMKKGEPGLSFFCGTARACGTNRRWIKWTKTVSARAWVAWLKPMKRLPSDWRAVWRELIAQRHFAVKQTKLQLEIDQN
jgi:hypothetical protein